MALAAVCAGCQTKLYSTISGTMNPRVAVFFLLVSVFSPGMFHSSTAYLPSSFAMYTNMLGMAAFMDWRSGLKTAQGIFWFAAGGIIGWPFATALVAPYLAEELLLAFFSQSVSELFQRVLQGTTWSLLALAVEVAVDSFFYRKLVCVPFNIFWYNVSSAFSSGSKAQIYGVEPWHFYIRNLILNFNAWFVLAAAAMPLVVIHHFLRRSTTQTQSILRSITLVSPFYLWLAIFTIQPHKEERFMYPAYPMLALNAAISFHIILSHFGSSDPKDLFSIIPAQLKLVIVSGFVLATINLGVLRSVGMATGYSAPLTVLAPLQQPGVVQSGDTVCMGKEWYRFPSSYFLPDTARAKFVRSEFKGLLPGEFSEGQTDLGMFPGTWIIPSGMNDDNIEDPGKYVSPSSAPLLSFSDPIGPSF
jgi:alpha-1,2-mannosyltransferase